MKPRTYPSVVHSLALAGLLGCSLGLTSCAWSIGGKKEGQTVVQPTQGQQLIDLKNAREMGALTEEEYEEAKKRILAQ